MATGPALCRCSVRRGRCPRAVRAGVRGDDAVGNREDVPTVEDSTPEPGLRGGLAVAVPSPPGHCRDLALLSVRRRVAMPPPDRRCPRHHRRPRRIRAPAVARRLLTTISLLVLACPAPHPRCRPFRCGTPPTSTASPAGLIGADRLFSKRGCRGGRCPHRSGVPPVPACRHLHRSRGAAGSR